MSNALPHYDFYESMALHVFENELQMNQSNSARNDSVSSSSISSSQKTSISSNSSNGKELLPKTHADFLNPNSPHFKNLANREIFYLGRSWLYYFENEPRDKLHNIYITNKRLVFYIIQEDGNYKTTYVFNFEFVKKCEIIDTNNADGACLHLVVKNRDQHGRMSLEESHFIRPEGSLMQAKQLAVFVNKAMSIYYETTHYVSKKNL